MYIQSRPDILPRFRSILEVGEQHRRCQGSRNGCQSSTRGQCLCLPSLEMPGLDPLWCKQWGDRYWYYDLLKHMERSPLTLSRLPRHLWRKIFEKQAAITSASLGQTCLEASLLVNEIVSGCEAASLLRDAVQLHTWKGLLDSVEYIDYETEDFLNLYPVKTLANTLLDRDRHWIGEDKLIVQDNQFVESLMRARDHLRNTRYIREKTDAQLRKWTHFQLRVLPDTLIKSIIHRMNFRSVSRFRQTTRSNRQFVDLAINTHFRISFAFSLMESMEDLRVIYVSRKDSKENSNVDPLLVLHANWTMQRNSNIIIRELNNRWKWSHRLTEVHSAYISRLRFRNTSFERFVAYNIRLEHFQEIGWGFPKEFCWEVGFGFPEPYTYPLFSFFDEEY